MGISKKSQSWLTKINSRITKRTGWIITIIALVLISTGGFAYYKLIYTATPAPVSAPLQTTVVRQGNLVIYASGNGTLVTESQSSFGFGMSGQVISVNAKTGDLVKAGDVLAELDNSNQQILYIQAKRALADLTSPYAIATAQLNIATAIQSVKTAHSQLEFLISPEVMYWEDRIAKDQQLLQEARAVIANPVSSDANNKVTQIESALKYDQDQLLNAQAYYRNTYLPQFFTTTDKDTGVEIVTGPSDATIAKARAILAQAQANVIETQNYLAALKGEPIPEDASGASITSLENAKSALKSAEDNLAGTRMIAPISGTLMSFDIFVGNQISSSTTVTIADLSQPYVQVYLDPSDWNIVKIGKNAEVTFDSMPDTKFTGTVTEVDPGLYTSGNTSVIRAMVKLEVPQTGFDLPLGSTASVDVIGGQATNALLIPIEALHPAGDQFTVFVMQNGKPTLRVVQVGIQDQVSAEIISGLEAGDVVTTGITGTKTQ